MNKFNLNYTWGLTNDVYDKIKEYLANYEVKTIVEFGSGLSTLQLANDFRNCNIISIENEWEYTSLTNKHIVENGLSHRCKVKYAPLTWRRFGSLFYKTYSTINIPENVDAVIIDGPPFWTRRGREAALHLVNISLHRGSVVIIDDYHRRAERQIVENWKRTYKNDFTYKFIDCGTKQICLMICESDQPVRKLSTHVIFDNYARNARMIFDRIFFPERLKP